MSSLSAVTTCDDDNLAKHYAINADVNEEKQLKYLPYHRQHL